MMAFATISNWVTTEWNDELEALARDKSHYADEAAAMAAQEKIDAIRAQATEELPMTRSGKAGGAVFASG